MSKKEISYYINIFKELSRFEFIDDSKLKELLYFFSAYVSYIYLEEIKILQDDDLKEIKAHTIFIYLWSIIESLIYFYVKLKLNDEKSKRKYLELEEFIKLQKIQETKDLYICKLQIKEIDFNNSINSHWLINWLKDKKLIDKSIINKIDYFRKMRNLVHINALLTYSEDKLIEELEKAFIDTKVIIDYIEDKI